MAPLDTEPSCPHSNLTRAVSNTSRAGRTNSTIRRSGPIVPFSVGQPGPARRNDSSASAADPDLAQHHGNVSQLDFAFGQLMKALGEQKLTDSTFVAFTSDNGPEGDGVKGRTRGSTGGLRGRKRAVYEGGIRVPAAVRWPKGLNGGKKVVQAITAQDVFPTLVAAAGVEAGVDLVQLVHHLGADDVRGNLAEVVLVKLC